MESKYWPHSPPHIIETKGIYFVTADTYKKLHHFKSEERRKVLHNALLKYAKEFGWKMQAWAVFSNHYHVVAGSPEDPSNLPTWIAKLHQNTASWINELDGTENRKVWFQYWDKQLTYHKSYLARLNYVHKNAVKHGLVEKASEYPWCSACWFEMKADRSFIKSVYGFDFNKVNEYDDFTIEVEGCPTELAYTRFL